jgi:hypothetical protein
MTNLRPRRVGREVSVSAGVGGARNGGISAARIARGGFASRGSPVRSRYAPLRNRRPRQRMEAGGVSCLGRLRSVVTKNVTGEPRLGGAVFQTSRTPGAKGARSPPGGSPNALRHPPDPPMTYPSVGVYPPKNARLDRSVGERQRVGPRRQASIKGVPDRICPEGLSHTRKALKSLPAI